MARLDMRILQVVPSLAKETGGPASSVPAISHALTNAGHQVTIFSTLWWGARKDSRAGFRTEDREGVKVHYFPTRHLPWISPLPNSPALVEAVGRHWRRFDRIICHSLWNPVASFSQRTLRIAGAPYVVMPHGMLDPVVFQRHAKSKFLWGGICERANVEGASALIFNSLREKERALYCGWRLPPGCVFPHIIDLEGWRRLPDRSAFECRYPHAKGREKILYVGRINWVKNLELLLDALRIVRRSRPSAMLVIIGPDSDRCKAKLEAQSRALGLQKDVLFTGMLAGEELKEAYAGGSVFALVSRKENFGLSAGEALACGLPLVLSEEVGLDLDKPLQGPVIRVPMDSMAIADALLKMLDRSRRTGIPDPEALSLASRSFGIPCLSPLLTFPAP